MNAESSTIRRINWEEAPHAHHSQVGGIHLFTISARTSGGTKARILKTHATGIKPDLGSYDTFDKATARAERALLSYTRTLGATFETERPPA